MSRIISLRELWSQPEGRWIVWQDRQDWLDATGDIISQDKSSITLGNRVDGKEIRILRTQIQHQEVLEE